MSRLCYYVPADAYVEGQGWRASVVREGESGHHPTGTWPYTGAVNQTMPYFWGHDYEEAKAEAAELNERMGISAADASAIVTSSMIAQNEAR
jgi:hypothetical protein